MKKLTKKQKTDITSRSFFWLNHAVHWSLAFVFLTFTLGLIYVFFANDPAFASAVMGG